MSQELLDTAVQAARAGAEVLRRHFRAAGLQVQAKSDHDFVTEADHESEARIVEHIRRRHPEHHILAEESGHDDRGESELEWLIDPLDGTRNFLQGLPIFCISVACRQASGEVLAGAVLDPLGDNLFTAVRGAGAHWNGRPMRCSTRATLDGAYLATGYPFRARDALDTYLAVFRSVFLRARALRRCGAAALDLAYTAAGVFDGFFEFRLSPWDFAAGVLLIREAGGRVTDLDGGDDFFRGGNLVAGSEGLHADLLRTVRGHADEAELDRLDPPRNN